MLYALPISADHIIKDSQKFDIRGKAERTGADALFSSAFDGIIEIRFTTVYFPRLITRNT